MAIEVYEPEIEQRVEGESTDRSRGFMPMFAALGFVAFVASAVVMVFIFRGDSTPPPETLAFDGDIPTQIELIEDETLEVELDTNGTAEEFTVESVDGPATAEIDDTTLLIEPAQDASGTVTVIVTACGQEGCVTTTIVAEVMARNDPPFANFDEAEIGGGEQVITIPVLANDSDVEDLDLEILEAELSEGDGEVTIVDEGTALQFRPELGSLGPWTMTYVITDGFGGFDQGTVTILDGNLEPQPADDQAEVLIGERVRVSPLENDIDDGGREALRIVEVSDPASGSVEFGDDWIDYVPGDEIGEVGFTYVVQDSSGRDAAAAVTVQVEAPALVLVDDNATTQENTAIEVDVLANDGPASADIDPQTLTVTSASSGTVAVGNGLITYDPPVDAAGEAFISYEVCSAFGECGGATLTIVVDAVVVGAFSSDGEITLPSNAGPQLVPWIAVSSGELTPPSGSSFSISTDRQGLFSSAPTIASNGGLSFTPQPGARGTATTRITANDPVNGQRIFEIRIVVR